MMWSLTLLPRLSTFLNQQWASPYNSLLLGQARPVLIEKNKVNIKIPMHTVVKLTGIRNTDLLGERPFSVILSEFLTWITTTMTTQEYAESTGNHYFPGIFVHHAIHQYCSFGGSQWVYFWLPNPFDGIDRRNDQLNTSLICTHNIHFADTLITLWKVC